MRTRLGLAVGAAVGYVLGARAGRGRYEELKDAAGRITENPTVKSTAAVVKEQAEKAQHLVAAKMGKQPAEAPADPTGSAAATLDEGATAIGESLDDAIKDE